MAQETDHLILVVNWITVWIQEFFERSFNFARYGYFQYICLHTSIVNCQIAWPRTTGHSPNSVYKIPNFYPDPSKISDTMIQRVEK